MAMPHSSPALYGLQLNRFHSHHRLRAQDGKVDDRPVWAKAFWTTIVVIINTLWIIFVWFYIQKYLEQDLILNEETLRNITPSQVCTLS